MKAFKVFLLLLFMPSLSGCLFESAPPGMVLVDSGEFTMGSGETDRQNHALSLGLLKPWYADESPERRVYLKGFYIDKFEVTNRKYYIFCQAEDHKPPRTWGGLKYPEGEDDLPLSHVNFYDAAAYAEWAGKRLPSEAEWEKAARGPLGNIYPWGNKFIGSAAHISASGQTRPDDGPRPVGSFPQGASPYGAMDMVGNLWEWVWDYYRPYPGSQYQSEDYNKKLMVVRGLSYVGVGHFPRKEYQKVVALKARASYRETLSPFARKKDVGFRCVKEIPSLFDRLSGRTSGK